MHSTWEKAPWEECPFYVFAGNVFFIWRDFPVFELSLLFKLWEDDRLRVLSEA
jgi:hypothetical protein